MRIFGTFCTWQRSFTSLKGESNHQRRKSNETQCHVYLAAVFLILVGLFSILVPVLAPAAMAGFGILDATARFTSMLSGVGWLALGVIAWLVRNAEPSKTRDSLVVGYTFLFALWAAVSLYGVTLSDMPSHTISWVPALIQALIAVGFFIAGRANTSTSVR